MLEWRLSSYPFRKRLPNFCPKYFTEVFRMSFSELPPKDNPKEEHEVPSWNKFRTRHLRCVPDCASKLVSPMRFKITSRNLFPKGTQFPYKGVPNKWLRIACSKEISWFKDWTGTQVTVCAQLWRLNSHCRHLNEWIFPSMSIPVGHYSWLVFSFRRLDHETSGDPVRIKNSLIRINAVSLLWKLIIWKVDPLYFFAPCH